MKSRRHERHDPLFEMGAFRQFMQLTAAFLAGRGSAPVCVRRRLDAMSRHPRSEKRARRTQTRVVRILDDGRQRECRPRSMRKPCLSSWRCLQKLISGWERRERTPWYCRSRGPVMPRRSWQRVKKNTRPDTLNCIRGACKSNHKSRHTNLDIRQDKICRERFHSLVVMIFLQKSNCNVVSRSGVASSHSIEAGQHDNWYSKMVQF